jgi:outer membrane protein OmpA-like peptidoglycan-associated protein
MSARLSLSTLMATFIGCANAPPSERIVLLPGADGKVGKVAITANDGSSVVSDAYGVASIDGTGKIIASHSDATKVQGEFASALAALPPRPVSYTLYFEHDSDQLTAESQRQAMAVLAEIASRPVADVIVIGHTDTVGALEYNDQLSLQRATVLRDELVKQGGDPARIGAAGRGERELIVQTSDERREPKNRRAELSVR